MRRKTDKLIYRIAILSMILSSMLSSAALISLYKFWSLLNEVHNYVKLKNSLGV